MNKYFNYSGGILNLKRDELLLTKEFCQLIERFKNPDTQHEIFRFIFFVADRNSFLVEQGLTDKEIRQRALKECNLPKTIRIEDLEPAIKKYKEISMSLPSVRVYISLLKSFNSADKVINLLIDEVEKKIEVAINDVDERVMLIGLLNELLDLGKRIPKDIESLSIAYKTMQKDIETAIHKKGGGEINSSAIPKVRR